jgi:ribosome-associated protein
VPATEEAVQLAVAAADAADDRKATDVQILEVADILTVVDVFLLATAASDRQLKAVVDRIEERLREDHDRKPLRREGTASSGWMLLDFGDLVCHLFSAEQRDFYALERLWADVPRREPRTGAPVTAPSAVAPDRTEDADLDAGDVAAAGSVTEGWLDPEEGDELTAIEAAELARLEAELDDGDDDGDVAPDDQPDAR